MTGSATYYADVCVGITDILKNILEIRSACGNNVHLKLLRDDCDRADLPVFNGSYDNYVRQAKSYAKDAQKIVIMYNIIRASYGLDKVGSGYD